MAAALASFDPNELISLTMPATEALAAGTMMFAARLLALLPMAKASRTALEDAAISDRALVTLSEIQFDIFDAARVPAMLRRDVVPCTLMRVFELLVVPKLTRVCAMRSSPLMIVKALLQKPNK